MSARIDAFKRLFAVRASITGSVVKINEQGYHVATETGTLICQNLTATNFKVSDSVRIVEGGIVGGRIAESSLPTFQV